MYNVIASKLIEYYIQVFSNMLSRFIFNRIGASQMNSSNETVPEESAEWAD